MAWDQAQEHYGGSKSGEAPAGGRLPLPHLQGGARLVVWSVVAPGQNLYLPDARGLALGQHYLIGVLTNSVTLRKQDTTTSVQTLAVGDLYEVWLIDNSTANGEWLVDETDVTAVGLGTPLTLGREPWELEWASSGNDPINLRRELDRRGYKGQDPVALTVTIQESARRGSNQYGLPALTSGAFPDGSTLLLVNRGELHGVGGVGGVGGEPPLFGAGGGFAGSPAITLRINTVLANYGIVAGGGGGGGGGQGGGTQGGGGGGGGSGLRPGRGGPAGSGGVGGNNGNVSAGGLGGSGGNNGGSGGFPGQAGSAGAGASGGAGGVAGNSIIKYDGAVLTKLTGTTGIFGPEISA